MKPERTTPAPHGRRAGPAHGDRCRAGGAARSPVRRRPPGSPARADASAPAAGPAGAPLPCPFCGREPAWEPHPDVPEIVRLACGHEACAIQPRTQYLLIEYADSLREAWNGRAG